MCGFFLSIDVYIYIYFRIHLFLCLWYFFIFVLVYYSFLLHPTYFFCMTELALNRRQASLSTAVKPIHKFLDDDAVIEIMLNADGKVWIEKVGIGLVESDVTMSPSAAGQMIRLVAAAMGSEVNESNPSLSGKLPGWGARVQATIPPIVEAPTFALRKPPKIIFSLDDYVNSQIISSAEATLLRSAILQGKNVLIGGGTGSGKTTLANALLQIIAETGERVYIVEDNPELQCAARNKVQVLVQPPVYTHQRAIMDAMRYRPDRICVGEVRDGSALEMLKAWNTGHPGFATVHANSARSMLDRISQLIEEVVPQAPHRLIADAIDLCVHIKRDPSHPAGRCLSGVLEVKGWENEKGWIFSENIQGDPVLNGSSSLQH